jgi:hypothetical protein
MKDVTHYDGIGNKEFTENLDHRFVARIPP